MIVVLLGPTGSGKSVFELECERQGLHRVISNTTRARRVGESENAYNFISKEDFERNIVEGKMIEYAPYRGNLYGVAKAELTDNCVVAVEPSGYYKLKQLYGDKVFAVYFEVSESERVKRAKKRGDCLKEISQRVLEDRELYTEELIKGVNLILTDIKFGVIPCLVNKYISKWKEGDADDRTAI